MMELGAFSLPYSMARSKVASMTVWAICCFNPPSYRPGYVMGISDLDFSKSEESGGTPVEYCHQPSIS